MKGFLQTLRFLCFRIKFSIREGLGILIIVNLKLPGPYRTRKRIPL